jgi:siroheme decarboxylase
MSNLDNSIVHATQDGLPLVAQPYRAVAAMLGVPHDEVLARIRAMVADGRIRRIGAVPNHYSLGYTANAMSVWDVDDAAVDELGRRVGALSFVSHCYLRPRRPPEWPYNLFAMVHGRSRTETQGKLEVIRELLGPALRGADALYSVRILKKTGMRLG